MALTGGSKISPTLCGGAGPQRENTYAPPEVLCQGGEGEKGMRHVVKTEMLPSKFIEQVFQGSKEMRRIEGQLLRKISPWEVTRTGACLPGLDSSTDLAFSHTHEVESPIAFPGEKREELDTEHIQFLTSLAQVLASC